MNERAKTARITGALIAFLVATAACGLREAPVPGGGAPSTADSTLLTTLGDSLAALPERYDAELAAGRTPDRDEMAGTAWRTLNARIADVSRRTPESAEREWLIGEAFQSAYRVDLHDSAFARAEQHLQRAMQLDSLFVPARIGLATLYVNSNPALAPRAERILRETPTRSGTAERQQVDEGLAFALYYQGRFDEAAGAARLAMSAGSTNGAMAMMAARQPARPSR